MSIQFNSIHFESKTNTAPQMSEPAPVVQVPPPVDVPVPLPDPDAVDPHNLTPDPNPVHNPATMNGVPAETVNAAANPNAAVAPADPTEAATPENPPVVMAPMAVDPVPPEVPPMPPVAPPTQNGSSQQPPGPPEAAAAPVPTAPAPVPTNAAPVPPGVQVVLPYEEFAEDLDLRLGRANGNIYQRKPGVEGVHDGQVMVRLKKKRFIIIDYGIVPNEHDLQASAMTPHINVPLGAGVTKCTGKVASEPGGPLVPCKKIGVPTLLYDSEPDQPPSLYLRSGLCFVCQRNLNEKRRTQRKRPSDRANHQVAAKVSATAHQSQAAFLAAQHAGVALGGPVPPPGATASLPGMQTVRIGGIGAQTNLVGAGTTGRVNSTPHHRVLMAVTNGHKKIKLAHTNQPLVLAPDAIILNGPPDNHSCKSVRAGHGFAEIGADLNVEVHQSLQTTQALLHSVNTPEMIQQGISPPTPDEISRTYDQAFYSLSKSLYLLVQWKTSWDAAIASAMQQEAHTVVAQQQQQQQQQQHHQQHHAPPPQQQQQLPPQPPAPSSAIPPTPQQQIPQQHASLAQQNAAALQAASMANAAATAAIGGIINGVPGSVPLPVHHHHLGGGEPTLAQAVASAAAVAAATTTQPAAEADTKDVAGAAHAPVLDQSVEV